MGVQTSEGVVLAVEKRLTSPLLEPNSIEKIMEVDSHIGCALSGLTADARTMIDHARVETQVRFTYLLVSCAYSFQNHRFNYDEPMKVESCVQAICDLALRFGENRKKDKEEQMVHGDIERFDGIYSRTESTIWCCSFSRWH